ncbi:hypothetical protein [Alphabaculovirus altersperidaniae]|uniref:Uncharacterized protein n=1 Tax=Spodoptera eridania nucleopolyhedrovirus TaxID=2315721 RepID=A0ABX6TV92_9ABAC|nr:hypothetical protein QKS47_gp005 [Spodoptera eridania nucleopolyhedrovirus]QNV47852.1 hypothetical protein [Spodoptera eridania nucleopolyhedrovirus]
MYAFDDALLYPSDPSPPLSYQLFCNTKKLEMTSLSIYSGKVRIVDYYTSIVYTEQYALHILHFRALFCTAKKFVIGSISGRRTALDLVRRLRDRMHVRVAITFTTSTAYRSFSDTTRYLSI